MIIDLRELRQGSLLSAREKLSFFIKKNNNLEKRYIEKDSIILYLGYEISQDPVWNNKECIIIKMLVNDEVYNAIIFEHNPVLLPQDLLNSCFVLPYFDVVEI